jgi:hypothetical protein
VYVTHFIDVPINTDFQLMQFTQSPTGITVLANGLGKIKRIDAENREWPLTVHKLAENAMLINAPIQRECLLRLGRKR